MSKGKTIDQKYMGPEPAFSGPISSNAQLSRALTWYNYFYTSADARQWLSDYVKNNFTKDQYALFKRLPDWRIPITDCALARLVTRGLVMPTQVHENMHNRILNLIMYAKTIEEEKKIVVVKPTISVQDRIKEKASNIIADIEDEVDKFYLNKYEKTKFSAYDILKARDAKTAQAEIITSYYRGILSELQEAVDKSDKQVVEAYSRISKKQLTAYRDFIKSIVDDCNRYFGNKVSIRKPRKKKEKSAVQLVGKLQFKKEDNELKLMSIDPINVIGAQSIWIYNTKYKKLTVLHAKNSAGLSIKGTTIIDFDEATSKSKTLRKPTETLQRVLSGGKVILRNLMTEIKTKESVAVGRTNSDTILLRITK
jgi:hypothetical protein